MSEEEKNKMLGLMKFWLFGTFIIIFAATTIFTGGALGLGLEIIMQTGFWMAMIVTALLCVIWFYVYRWYLNR
jgi:hypothetical protein